jgi:hypothetical protein
MLSTWGIGQQAPPGRIRPAGRPDGQEAVFPTPGRRINPQAMEDQVKTYTIRRKQAWRSPEELEAAAGRSKEVAASEFPQDILWLRSYVVVEEDGTLGSTCIYQASGFEAIREHASRVGMPADEINEVADTVVIRPDPAPDAATA